MQITFDNIIFSLQKFGGISVVWSELLRRACTDSNLRVQVLDYPHTNANRMELSIPQEQINQLPMRWGERYRIPDWKPTSPTIFHSSYFRICPHPSVKNCTTVHDLTYHFYRKGIAKRVHLWEEERALRNSQAVICISENTKQDLLHAYPWLNEDSIHVIYNGVSEDFAPIPSITKQGYLLYIGTRSVDYKRFDVAVEVARLTGKELVAIGAPLTDKEQAWLDSVLPNQYRVVTGISGAQLNRFYNEALCLLYPSDYEGFGLPVIEAQKAGCPVLAQRKSSIPEIIGDNGWMVSPATVPAMAQEMAQMVKELNSRSIESLIANGLQNAKRFSWDTTYNQTKQVYTRLAEEA